jgi:hypothetical protein
MYNHIRQQHLYSVRPGLTTVQVRLKFGASGAVGSDGYGNTLTCDDVVRVSGEEKHATKHNWIKGLVGYGEWASAPDLEATTAPLTRTATGTYTLRFDDEYLGLNGFKWGIEDSSNTNKHNVILVSFTASDTNNAGRSSAIVRLVSVQGGAADPANDSYVWLEFSLKTSEQG